MEAICYVAEMKAVPTMAELQLAGADSVVDFFEKKDLGECDTNGNPIALASPPFIADSPKERPLHDRLAKFLPLFYHRLNECGAIRKGSTVQVLYSLYTTLIHYTHTLYSYTILLHYTPTLSADPGCDGSFQPAH
jgi:hypothetical protein